MNVLGHAVTFLFILRTIVCVNIDGTIFARELSRLADDAIGITKLQRFYDELEYESKGSGSGSKIVEDMAKKLSSKFESYKSVLEETKQLITSELSQFPSEQGSLQECCRHTALQYDTHFGMAVDKDSVCISKSPSTDSRKYPSPKIIDKMKENLKKDEDLLWQYFGDEDGTFLIHPAKKITTNCNEYDPRLRPFYVAAATQIAKDIVIVLDTSQSMTTQYESLRLMTYAKQAAIATLETLNPEDRVAVLGFSDSTTKMKTTAEDCYQSELAVATRTNKAAITDFINTLYAKSGSNFSMAFHDALQFFVDSPLNLPRERLIIFLTDGVPPAEDKSCDVIKDQSGKIQNDVTIHIIGLGRNIGKEGQDRLTNLTTSCFDSSKGNVKPGFYESVVNATTLKVKMALYYKKIASGDVSKVSFSTPFIDTQSNKVGLIMSLCVSVLNNAIHYGVLCVDIRLSELFADLQYFKEGESSYAFLIDGHGNALVHYLLPYPSAYITDRDQIDIHIFERGIEAAVVINSMISGETGNTSFASQRTISRGALLFEGIESPTINSHYFWTNVAGTNFSLCVVLAENDAQQVLKEGQQALATSDDKFLYHRRDLYRQSYTNCRQFTRFATIEKSMVMLTPHAFENPYEYLYKKETEGDAKSYTDYMNGKTSNKHGIKDGVKTSVAATYKAEKIWKENRDTAKYVIWRYLGTSDGHVRVYPAVQITQDYDHTLRAWWKRTIAFKGLNVVIAPYIDLWGAGIVITQCKALYEGKRSGTHSKQDKVEAAICTDFPYPYFSRMFLSKYQDCMNKDYSCILIDVNGYLIVHPDFDMVTSSPNIERIFLGAKEGEITDDLKALGIMTNSPCSNFETNKNQYTYFVALESTQSSKDRFHEKKYKIVKVADSNVFIIIKKRASTRSCCTTNVSPDIYPCSGSDCCLCYRKFNYDVCQNTRDTAEAIPACSARIPDSNSPSPNDTNKIKGLPVCFPVGCSNRQNISSCYDVAGCSWCTQGYRGNILEKGCCNLLEVCPFGQQIEGQEVQCPSLTSSTTTASPPKSEFSTEIIGGISGGVVLIILIVAVAIFKIFRKRRTDDPTDYITAVPDYKEKDERNDQVQYKAYSQQGVNLDEGNFSSESDPNKYHMC